MVLTSRTGSSKVRIVDLESTLVARRGPTAAPPVRSLPKGHPMPDPTAQPLAEIEAVAVAMHDALYPGRHDQEWATLDEEEREEYRRMAVAAGELLGVVVSSPVAVKAVARARSVIETKVWAATLAGLLMAVAPIAYDVTVAYAAGWPEAPPWIAPLLVALGTLGAGYGAKHTPRPDLVAS